MALADNYRCRSGKGCTGRSSDGAAVVATHNTVCQGCVGDLQRQLDELPGMANNLHRYFLAAAPMTALQSKVNSTPEPSCPLNTRVDALIGDLEDVVDRTGGMTVAELINEPAVPFILWIGDRRQEQHLDGVQRALDVRRAHARANAILGSDRAWQKRLSPCWQCGLPTVGGYVGDSTVLCSECGAVFFSELEK